MCTAGRVAVAVCALLVCVGCQHTVFVASRGAYVDLKHYSGGTPFRVATSNTFGVWGLLPPAKVVHVDRLVSRALQRDVKIISGLRITQYVGPLQILAEIFTLGLVVPRTIVVEGSYHERGLSTSPVP